MALIFVDCEAPLGIGSPSVGDMTEFGAVEYVTLAERYDAREEAARYGLFGELAGPVGRTFHGRPGDLKRLCREEIWRQAFIDFDVWLSYVCAGKKGGNQPVFVTDNVAWDWQWINFYFWRYLGRNPFGHSGRRIGDFYAGLLNDFHQTQRWKRLRVTKHDHDPVHDATGNVEAFDRMLKGERA